MGIKQQYRPLVVLFAALSSILLIFTVIVPAQVRTQETQENPNITFSNVYFERWGADLFSDTYSQTDGWAVHDRGTLKAQFGVEPGVTVQNGDEFWLEMPESYDGSAFKFLDTSSVPLKLEDGTEVGTCVLTNELSPSRVTYTVAAEDVADNQNFQGSFALNVRATDTLDTVTPEMNSSGGVVTGELPTRTFTNIPNPADGKRTWTEAPADYNTYGIIPRNDISRDPRTDITKAGDWGRDANNWRVYFGANAIDKNGTVVITDTLAEDQQFQPNGNV